MHDHPDQIRDPAATIGVRKEDLLDTQSLPLYFSDQSKYQFHHTLELVTQLPRLALPILQNSNPSALPDG
ncbi:uncharacterized protein B0I36DRAFT_341496 [Microdochium trichocladiopsis]|uniref:Uncharacterized protein n=1 Tax=Microdochium trichocladiopsis TaxID=1682393 RepID=A0A9P8XQJ4_9PEZI|nr:uncharacterized protein B0I36DRAFT_341496 [Microdochium trichocladiopsis]KAH7010888.1 hypothetical protein B0I36DRAFT_341496 [Microdochium trichocladiopsis]